MSKYTISQIQLLVDQAVRLMSSLVGDPSFNDKELALLRDLRDELDEWDKTMSSCFPIDIIYSGSKIR